MEFEEFIEVIKVEISGLLGQGKEVYLQKNLKNNNIKKQSLIIKSKNKNTALNIYLQEYYERFLEGESIEKIIDTIILFDAQTPELYMEDTSIISDYESAKDKIIYRLVGQKDNDIFLKEHPHRNFLDMAIVYYLLINKDDKACISMMIKEDHLKLWGISEAHLYEQAKYNTRVELPYKFCTLVEELKEQLEMPKECIPKTQDTMYILSNCYNHYGAAYILYEDILSGIYNELGEDYYVIPGSVHEIFIIPVSSNAMELGMKETIINCNTNEVDKEEVLSNNAYRYVHEKGLEIYL